MIDNNGEIMPFDVYNNKVGVSPDNLIDYVQIKTGISKIRNKISFIEENRPIQFHNQNAESLTRKAIYKLILKTDICHCETIWERKLGKKINENTWNNIFACTKEVKLQEIQWKIVHNIFPTNILLTRMGKEKSEKCEVCDEIDFVEHMFF